MNANVPICQYENVPMDIVQLKNCCNFAFDYYSINFLGKKSDIFLNKIEGTPTMVVRKETTVQPQTPSVCCDSHTYGGRVLFITILFAMTMNKNLRTSETQVVNHLTRKGGAQ
jgi:hypothetical protein